MNDIKIQILLSPDGMFKVQHNSKSALLALGIMAMAIVKEANDILNPKEPRKVIPFTGPLPPNPTERH